MSPQVIPWLLCSLFCIIPVVIGSLTFYLWIQFTNRMPRRDITSYTDDVGRIHTVTEWVNISREELKLEKQIEKEAEGGLDG
jgi:hypothetical protein